MAYIRSIHPNTASDRAEDIAYTINHAIACTVTDFIDPYVGDLTQQWLGRRVFIGCQHDHGDQAHCDHHHAHHGHGKQWVIGEVAGDFGAVPVTVAFQRYVPGFMLALREVIEPLLGGLFRFGARHSAQGWARKQGLDERGQVCKDKAAEIYEHEMRHLPQALLWTASSITINLCTQRVLGNKGPLLHMLAGKAAGASISAGLVVAGRSLMPQTAHDWDRFTSEHLFLPLTKTAGKLAGITPQDVDRMAQKQEPQELDWAERMHHAQKMSRSR